MKEIRIGHSGQLSPQHRVQDYADWSECTPAAREDCEIVVRTANELFGSGTHWIEERDTHRTARAWVSKFGHPAMPAADFQTLSPQPLSTDSRRIRLDGALEQEYTRYLRKTHQRNGMLLMWLVVIGCCVLTITDLLRPLAPAAPMAPPPWLVSTLLVRGSELMFSLVCIALIGWGCTMRSDILCTVVLLCAAFAGGTISALGRVSDLPSADLLLLILAAFFPIGLAFRQSMALAFAMAFASSLPGLVLLPGEALSMHSNFLIVLLLTAGFAGIAGYARELASRREFLRDRLLRQQAALDPLTGLHNRRWMDDHLPKVQKHARTHRCSMSFMLIDVDHFKQYNDRHGHLASDAALVAIGRHITAHRRNPLDVATRLGGDEFGLLLFDCSLPQALAHGEKLRAAIHALGPAEIAADALGQLSISIGIVQIRPDEQAQSFYCRADRLLFQSKTSGRNRVAGAGATSL